jgi:glycosyltransferase involved in cell wall biosynthesis
MKIAQVAPLIESVPPKGYGGTERIVSYLTEQLVRLGHNVTLFASGDSKTAAKLVRCSDRALRLDGRNAATLPATLLMLEQVRRRAEEFDILHFHVDLLHCALFRPIATRTVTTLHGRLDIAGLSAFYREFSDLPLVSISMSQRAPMPPVAWAGNVYHGLPAGLLRFESSPADDYLAFLGRISPEKRVDRAIEVARAAKLPLQVSAKIDPADREYHLQIADKLKDPIVSFPGEIGESDKGEFLGNARALLFPIDWPEPFGLVMIEAMACGTPVIAYPNGSVPEILEHGVTGFIVESIEAAAEAVEAAKSLDRARIRERFEKRFTAERMTQDYLAVYRGLLEDRLGRRLVETAPSVPKPSSRSRGELPQAG